MQLGEVEITEAPPPPPPKSRRRRTAWLLLLALVMVVGFLARHGPGVVSLEPGELGVVTATPGIPLLEDRVVETPGTRLYLPLGQTFTRLDASPRITPPRAALPRPPRIT